MKLTDFHNKIEFALHICILLFLMNAIEPLRREMSGLVFDPIEGDAIQRGILLTGYLLTIPIITIYPISSFRVMRRSPLLWFMILWAAVSILWSGSPDITFRRVIAILLTTLYALALYLRYPFQSFLRLLGATFFVAVISSLLMVAVVPDWGIMSVVLKGDWRGIFMHKNVLGKVSTFALCFFATLIFDSRNRGERLFWAGAFVLGMITLIGSRSATGLVVTGTMTLGALLLRAARPWGKAWPVFLMIILLIGSGVILLIIQNSEIVLDALGRDISLSGRVPLWQVLIPMGLKQPLGYGYGAFWLGWNGPSAEVWSRLAWRPNIAHNGFIDLWLGLGWVGLGLGIILLGRIFMKNLGPALTGSKEAVFWVLFCIIIITYNLVEETFFDQNIIYWVLIAYAYFSTQLRLLRGRVPLSLAAA
jgi:exopolysaccharide production protein ExoQ